MRNLTQKELSFVSGGTMSHHGDCGCGGASKAEKIAAIKAALAKKLAAIKAKIAAFKAAHCTTEPEASAS